MSFFGEHTRAFIRATIGSIGATVVEFGVLSFMVRVIHVRHWLAYALVQVLGTLMTFLLNRYWAFRTRGKKQHIGAQGAKYVVVFGASFGLNTLLPSIGSYKLHMPPEAAFLVAQALVYLGWNYPMNRFWVFKKAKGGDGRSDAGTQSGAQPGARSEDKPDYQPDPDPKSDPKTSPAGAR